MAVRDWINYPRDEETSAGWRGRANAWMNTLVDCVNDLDTRLTAAEADIDDLEAAVVAPTAYTPTLYNFTTSSLSATYTLTNKQLVVDFDATVATVAAGNLEFSLPYTPARSGLFVRGELQLFDASTSMNYFGRAEALLTPDRLGFVANVGTTGSPAATRVTNLFPVTVAAGDILRGSFALTTT